MSKLHIDATLVAARRMAELQTENEQLRAKITGLIESGNRLAKSLDFTLSDIDRLQAENERLCEKLRIAEAVRDDARAASQRDLDEKRAVEEAGAELTAMVVKMMPSFDPRVRKLMVNGESHEIDRPDPTCACSPKYRELAPGVHAAYCPLRGKPLETT
jgi:chromosome segregation ATPase